MSIPLNIQFSGGLEYLFDYEPSHPLKMDLNVPAVVPVDNSSPSADHPSPSNEAVKPKEPAVTDTKPADVTYLIHHLRDHHLKERVELFMENGTV